MSNIIVEIKGGVVQAVYSTSKNVSVTLCDWDNADSSEKTQNECEAIMGKVNKSKRYTQVF